MIIVCVYSLNDELIYAGTYEELANLFNTTKDSLKCMVSRCLSGKINHSYLGNQKVKFYKFKDDGND